MKKTLKAEGVEECVVDGKIIFLISSVVMVGAIVIAVLYNYPIVRYILVGTTITIGFMCKKKIISTYSVIKRR